MAAIGPFPDDHFLRVMPEYPAPRHGGGLYDWKGQIIRRFCYNDRAMWLADGRPLPTPASLARLPNQCSVFRMTKPFSIAFLLAVAFARQLSIVDICAANDAAAHGKDPRQGFPEGRFL